MKVRHRKLRNINPLYVQGEKGRIDEDGFVKGLRAKTLEWLVRHVPGYEEVKETEPRGNGGGK